MKPSEKIFSHGYRDTVHLIENQAKFGGVEAAKVTSLYTVERKMQRVIDDMDRLNGMLTCLKDANLDLAVECKSSILELRQRMGQLNRIVDQSVVQHRAYIEGETT